MGELFVALVVGFFAGIAATFGMTALEFDQESCRAAFWWVGGFVAVVVLILFSRMSGHTTTAAEADKPAQEPRQRDNTNRPDHHASTTEQSQTAWQSQKSDRSFEIDHMGMTSEQWADYVIANENRAKQIISDVEGYLKPYGGVVENDSPAERDQGERKPLWWEKRGA